MTPGVTLLTASGFVVGSPDLALTAPAVAAGGSTVGMDETIDAMDAEDACNSSPAYGSGAGASDSSQPARLATALQQLQLIQDELYKAQGEQGEAFSLKAALSTITPKVTPEVKP